MNVGLVVEGNRDSVTYPELVHKIRSDIEAIRAISCGDVAKLKTRFVGWLKHFEWNVDLVVAKVLVIMDSDCSDAAVWETQLQQVFDQSRFHPRFAVHFHATKCELESWLLADENAVNEVARQRGKNKRVQAVTVNLETHRNAKELFQRVLSDAGLPADARVYQEIAAAADLERIALRCPSFRQFAQKVLAD